MFKNIFFQYFIFYLFAHLFEHYKDIYNNNTNKYFLNYFYMFKNISLFHKINSFLFANLIYFSICVHYINR